MYSSPPGANASRDAAVDPPWGREEFELGGRAQTEVEGRTPEWFKQPYPPPLVCRPLVTHPGFRKLGEKVTRPMPFEQSVEDYIECLHSRASYCREVLGEDVVRRFDSDLAKLLSRFARDGRVRFSVQSRMEWGRPDVDSGAHGRQDPDEECR